jgi:hypothetical protein
MFTSVCREWGVGETLRCYNGFVDLIFGSVFPVRDAIEKRAKRSLARAQRTKWRGTK